MRSRTDAPGHKPSPPNRRTLAGTAILVVLAASLAGAGKAVTAEQPPRDLVGHGGPVRAVAVDPRHGTALTGSFDYSAIFWRLPDGDNPALVLARLSDHGGAVNAVAFTPDGSRGITASDDGSLGVYDLARHELVARFIGHSHKVVAVAVSPDGRLAVSGSWGRTARLWHLDTLTPGPVLKGHANSINDVAFTGDGAHVLTAGYDGTIRQWSAATGEEERIVYKHGWGVNVIEPLDDGKAVVFGGLDGTAGLLDLATGEVTRKLSSRDRPLLSIAYDATSRLVALGGGDGILEVFETTGWQVLERLENPYGPVWALAFEGDGNSLYFAGLDDQVHYWRFRPGAGFTPAIGTYPRRFQLDDDIDPGQRQFARKCSVCHTLTEDGGHRAGPTLYGLFGRKAGSVPGYAYTDTLKSSDVVWTSETVEQLFAQGPDHFMPGTKMPLQKMTNRADLKALIDYLRTATRPRP